MLNYRRSNSIEITSTMYLYYFIYCIVLVLILDRLPDYSNYKSIYESGGGYLLDLGRDLGFVLMVNIFNDYINYDLFRVFLFLFSAAGIIYFSRCLQSHMKRRLSFLTSIPLLLIILMKFAIQFREGLAILVWLLYLTSHQSRLESVKFLFYATVSSFFHLAIIPYWVATFLIIRKKQNHSAANFLIFLIFSISIYVVCTRHSPVANFDDFFATIKEEVNPSPYNYIYWSLFIVFPFFWYMNLKWIDISKSSIVGDKIYALAPISIYGSIGVSFTFLLFLVFDPTTVLNKTILSDILRIQTQLLMLILLQINFRKYFLVPAIFLIFLAVDSFRIIIASYSI